jgi:hypothetical protein
MIVRLFFADSVSELMPMVVFKAALSYLSVLVYRDASEHLRQDTALEAIFLHTALIGTLIVPVSIADWIDNTTGSKCPAPRAPIAEVFHRDVLGQCNVATVAISDSDGRAAALPTATASQNRNPPRRRKIYLHAFAV